MKLLCPLLVGTEGGDLEGVVELHNPRVTVRRLHQHVPFRPHVLDLAVGRGGTARRSQRYRGGARPQVFCDSKNNLQKQLI